MSDPNDMDKPVTKREFLAEMQRFKTELKTELAEEIRQQIGAFEERNRDFMRALFEPQEHRIANVEKLPARIDKLEDLPPRVEKLEAAVFPAPPVKRQRRR